MKIEATPTSLPCTPQDSMAERCSDPFVQDPTGSEVLPRRGLANQPQFPKVE